MNDLDRHYYRVSRQAARQMGFAVKDDGAQDPGDPAASERSGPTMPLDNPDFELLGRAQGRVVLQNAAGIGAVQAVFNGHGTVLGVPIADSGTFTYTGQPRLFAGEVDVVLLDVEGTKLGRWRGRNVGKHLNARSAVIHAVGMFETVSAAAPPQLRALRGQFALAKIDLIEPRSYCWSLWRLGFDRAPESMVSYAQDNEVAGPGVPRPDV